MSKSGLLRDTTDKFYTCDKSVRLCIQTFIDSLEISKDDTCIEPSAGDGAFITSIKEIFNHYAFYDIKPENKEIITQDFLELDTNLFQNKCGRIHILGNPPFGRQSSLAIKFIKHCALFADTISFVLPRSFRKESMKRHFPRQFHLLCDIDMPCDSFTIENKTHNVPCIFQVWQKQDAPRALAVKSDPIGYMFVKQDDHHDIAIRRVGVYAGSIYRETANKSPQSHYFIRFTMQNKEKIYLSLLEKLTKIEYPTKDNTVGPRSISKGDIVTEFNKIVTQY